MSRFSSIPFSILKFIKTIYPSQFIIYTYKILVAFVGSYDTHWTM